MSLWRIVRVIIACAAFPVFWVPFSYASSSDGGHICVIEHGFFTAPRFEDGSCPKDTAYSEEHDICRRPVELHNSFVFSLNEDGSMVFGMSRWTPGGAHCGLTGIAEETENGWRYIDESGQDDDCTVDIVMEDDKLVIKPHGHNACRRACGVTGSLHKLSYSLKYLRRQQITPEHFTPFFLYHEPCPE